MPIKLNCWEIKRCDRGPNGAKVNELGLCPVTVENRLDNVHGGSHAGRCCWVVARSLCGGKVQGSFEKKFQDCEKCEVYAAVRHEEFPNFQFSSTLLARLRR